jgi:hypothetical protein
MADNSKMVSELAIAANIASTDRLLVLRDPAANPSVRTITLGNISANLQLTTLTPANSSANGLAGTIRYDSSYVYVCVANNTWKRASLTSW